MSKKSSSFGLGTIVGAVAGVLTGAVAVFLSDKENRTKVVREAKKVEKMVEKDLRKAKSQVKKTSAKVKKAVKKASKKVAAKKRK